MSEITPLVNESTSNSQCGQQNEFENDQQLMKTLKKVHQHLSPPGCNRDPSSPLFCKDVIRCNSSATSGYYQIQAASNGSAVQVSVLHCKISYVAITDDLLLEICS